MVATFLQASLVMTIRNENHVLRAALEQIGLR